MSGLQKYLEGKAKIAVLRGLFLGDLLCAVPAFRALRKEFPDAEISLIGLPWASAFVHQFNHLIDRHIPFPGYPGLPEQQPDVTQIPSFLNKVQNEHFDLVLQMHGSGSIVNPLVVLFGAEVTAGYCLQEEFCPDDDYFMEYPSQEPEVRRHLRLLEFLDVPIAGEYLEFPVFDTDWETLQKIQIDNSLEQGNYICIHPGSRSASRRWPTGHFAYIADALAAKGFRIVLTGTREEQSLASDMTSQMKGPIPINLCGKTDLGTLGALLSNSRLLVSNDTGVSHLADALRVPSVVIFSGSDPKRWAPLDTSLHHQVFQFGGWDRELVLSEVQSILQQERDHAG